MSPAAPTATGARVWNWDALRVLATVDIAALHVTGQHALLGFGLPLYLVLTCALATRGQTTVSVQARERLRRLMVPWWWGCLLYASVSLWDPAGGPAWSEFGPARLLVGSHVHLWFLPFATLAGVGLGAVAQHMRDVPSSLRSLGGALMVALCLPLAARAPAAWPWSQWVFSLPALALGLGLGGTLGGAGVQRRHVLNWGLSALGALTAVALLDGASRPLALRYGVAVLALAGAALAPQRQSRLAVALVPLLLTVYIVHPFVFDQLLHDRLWRWGVGGAHWARLGGTLLCSVALAWMAQRLPALWRGRTWPGGVRPWRPVPRTS